jgi:hypothetical protein
MAFNLLYEDADLRIEKAGDEPLLIVRRTATRPSAAVIRSFVGKVGKAFAGFDRSRHAMLVDLRAAALRTDPELDAALAAFREEVARDSIAIARLVSTSVGALQSVRVTHDAPRPVRTFSDEGEALAWLRGQLVASRGSARH